MSPLYLQKYSTEKKHHVTNNFGKIFSKTFVDRYFIHARKSCVVRYMASSANFSYFSIISGLSELSAFQTLSDLVNFFAFRNFFSCFPSFLIKFPDFSAFCKKILSISNFTRVIIQPLCGEISSQPFGISSLLT